LLEIIVMVAVAVAFIGGVYVATRKPK